MIPENLEYLFLLFLYLLLIVTFLTEPLLKLLPKRSFWISCSMFCLTWALIEIYALQARWWVFSPGKICGVFIATVPIEEYILFILIHASIAATYCVIRNLNDVA